MKINLLACICVILGCLSANAETVYISSLRELDEYAAKNGNTVVMKRGFYRMTDYLNEDSIAARLRRKYYQYITFSGNNNDFRLDGVHIEVDTRLRQKLNHPIHTSEIVMTGNNNRLSGLKVTCTGNGTSPGGSLFSVSGDHDVLRQLTFWVQGSFPYGYGDLFGKGGPDVIRHQKHSGFRVTGTNIKVLDCKLYMHSFGHGYYIQEKAQNIYFENCHVEGESRKTEDVLSEPSGPAFDVKFRTWTPNREGNYIVTPGYMKSLCEDGFRTYGNIKDVTFVNCTAKNTRGGFELRRTEGRTYLENCTTIGTERAYWIWNGAILKNCKGDAGYGPVLFVEGNNAKVELEVVAEESDRIVHSLATIQGSNNEIKLTSYQGKYRTQPLPILIGYTHPEHGESMSPYSEGNCSNLVLSNETKMPLIISEKAAQANIQTNGAVIENKGQQIKVKK